MKRLLLKNANVVLPDREVKNAAVLIAEGKIAAIGGDLRDDAAESVDLSGATLLPGFIDVHIHGSAGIDVMNATPGGLQEVSEYLAMQGVTAWLPTLVPAADAEYEGVAAAVAESMRVSEGKGARVLGLHYEGPFVNSAQCGALHVEHFKSYSGPRDLDRLAVREDMVRMITLAPEVEGGVELVRELKKRGWVISIGHTRAGIQVLDQAFEAGARHMTHFMNAMAPLHHRNPGPIAWGLSRDQVTFDVIADAIHLDPFMLRLLLKIKGVRGICLISDAIAPAGRGDGEYQIWGETITVKDGRTSNAAGSIAGSVITMLDAVRVMRSVGASQVEHSASPAGLSVSYVDLAQMAATNPARLLGLDQICGSIEVGKRADLIALDDTGNVRLTLIAGQLIFTA